LSGRMSDLFVIGRGPTEEQIEAAIAAIPLVGGYDLYDVDAMRDTNETEEFAFDLSTNMKNDETMVTTLLSGLLGVRVLSIEQWESEINAAHPECDPSSPYFDINLALRS